MSGLLDRLGEEDRGKVEKRDRPSWAAPMLATLTHEPFSDEGWIYERKLDGVRVLAFVKDGRVRLVSRNRESQNATYPELVDALEARALPEGIYDGEVTAFSGGVSSFSRLQRRMGVRDAAKARERAKRVKVRYYLFDLMHLEGHDVTGVPLRSRRGLLRTALEFGDPIHLTPHRNRDGLEYLDEACGKGWEGLIAKKADSRYVAEREAQGARAEDVAVRGGRAPVGEGDPLGGARPRGRCVVHRMDGPGAAASPLVRGSAGGQGPGGRRARATRRGVVSRP